MTTARGACVGLAATVIAASGCGGGEPPPKPSKASVERALRGWVRSAQGRDAEHFCSRTFILYDTASFLWRRLEFVDPPDSAPSPTEPPSRVHRDCLEEFVFQGRFAGAIFSGTRIVAIRRIRVEGPVHGAGGITRTAVAEVILQHHSRPPVTSRLHLVRYRGRWRVTLRNG